MTYCKILRSVHDQTDANSLLFLNFPTYYKYIARTRANIKVPPMMLKRRWEYKANRWKDGRGHD